MKKLSNLEWNNDAVADSFASLPLAAILAAALRTQTALKTDAGLIEQKSEADYVTQADREIQQLIIDHFAASPLAGSYLIKAEEELAGLSDAEPKTPNPLQLIIDPLDGTNAFCRGEHTWGTMIGLCDDRGRLLYSWNMVSNGELFTDASAAHAPPPGSWEEAAAAEGRLAFDVVDYGGDAAARFSAEFRPRRSTDIAVCSLPAAVWAGWELYCRRLSGLLWLPSQRGKRNYPDYDLILLGALTRQGWCAALGRSSSAVEMVAVAPRMNELDELWHTGLRLLAPEHSAEFEKNADLQITSPVQPVEKG